MAWYALGKFVVKNGAVRYVDEYLRYGYLNYPEFDEVVGEVIVERTNDTRKILEAVGSHHSVELDPRLVELSRLVEHELMLKDIPLVNGVTVKIKNRHDWSFDINERTVTIW